MQDRLPMFDILKLGKEFRIFALINEYMGRQHQKDEHQAKLWKDNERDIRLKIKVIEILL